MQGCGQCAIDQRCVAWHYQEPAMTSRREACAYARKRSGKVRLVVANHSIREGCVSLVIAIAGNKQIIRQWPYDSMRPGYERLAMPLDQTFVLASHPLPATTRQQQD